MFRKNHKVQVRHFIKNAGFIVVAVCDEMFFDMRTVTQLIGVLACDGFVMLLQAS